MTLILIGKDLLLGGKTKGLNGFQVSVWHCHHVDHEVISHFKWLGTPPFWEPITLSKDDWGVLHHLQKAYYLGSITILSFCDLDVIMGRMRQI